MNGWGMRADSGSWGRVRVAPAVAMLLTTLCVETARAHVGFVTPESGTELVVGTTVELEWRILQPHTTLAHHLEFYLEDGAEPVSIAADLPADQLSYSWTVPDMPCDACSLVVIQDNEGADYSSRATISIVYELSEPGSGGSSTGMGGVLEGSGGSSSDTGGAGGGMIATGGTSSGGQAAGVGGGDSARGALSTGGAVPSATDEEGGCSLSVGGLGSSSWWAALLALVALRWRGRRSVD